MKSFQDLELHPALLKAIEDAGYTTPTPIQEQAIPKILAGLDLRASAQTGTGKSAAFLLPALQRLTNPSPLKARGPRVLILVPTRELAMQVAAEAVKYSKHLSKVKTICIYGGAPYPLQNRQLSQYYEILVATPGRLIDHLEQGRISFDRLEMLVLDEADRMLDMGFIEPVEKIAAMTPKERQTLLFSATMKGSVMKLSEKLLHKPIEISVAAEKAKHENIEQRIHHVDDINHKQRLLEHFVNDPSVTQAIVFTATKRHCDQLLDKMLDRGVDAAALHGDMNQRQRTRTITDMREGRIRVLIATDVAARGIDVQNISHVINFDLPNGVEDYVHRIGRTGRAGAKGLALSFAAPKDMGLVKRIQQFTGQEIEFHTIPGLEPKSKLGSGGSGAPQRARKPYGSRPGAPYGKAPYGKAPYGKAPYGKPPGFSGGRPQRSESRSRPQ